MHAHSHTHTHTRMHARTHVRAHASVHRHAHTLTHAHMHALMHAHTHTHMHAHTVTHTHAHTHTHTHTHTRQSVSCWKKVSFNQQVLATWATWSPCDRHQVHDVRLCLHPGHGGPCHHPTTGQHHAGSGRGAAAVPLPVLDS